MSRCEEESAAKGTSVREHIHSAGNVFQLTISCIMFGMITERAGILAVVQSVIFFFDVFRSINPPVCEVSGFRSVSLLFFDSNFVC